MFDDYVDCHRLNDADLIQAMNESRLMLWASGPDNENLHANPVLEYYTGRAAIEFRRLGWVDIIHPEDREKTFETVMAAIRSRQPFLVAYRARRYDGLYCGMIDQARPRFRPDGNFAGYIGTTYQIATPGMSVAVLVYEHSCWIAQERLIIPAGTVAARMARHR